MNNLYLFPVYEGIEIDKTPVIVSCSWRWIAQPSFNLVNINDNLFVDSNGKPSWVFQTDKPIEGFEAAPEKYPNGVDLLEGAENKPWNVIEVENV